jgi:hypothetical protein
VTYFPQISICKNQTLAAIVHHRFTTAHRNWSREEDEDITAMLPIIFLEPEDPHVEPSLSPEPGEAALPPWATTVTHQVVCCPRWAPPWSPLHFAIFPIAFGALEHPGHRTLVSHPPRNGTAGFPLWRRRRTRQSWPPPPVIGSTARIRSHVPLRLY